MNRKRAFLNNPDETAEPVYRCGNLHDAAWVQAKANETRNHREKNGFVLVVERDIDEDIRP